MAKYDNTRKESMIQEIELKIAEVDNLLKKINLQQKGLSPLPKIKPLKKEMNPEEKIFTEIIQEVNKVETEDPRKSIHEIKRVKTNIDKLKDLDVNIHLADLDNIRAFSKVEKVINTFSKYTQTKKELSDLKLMKQLYINLRESLTKFFKQAELYK
jgi:hypothetical protein